jgi:hypothetical protein
MIFICEHGFIGYHVAVTIDATRSFCGQALEDVARDDAG